MNPVSDNELILHHYRDGLDARRMAEIDAELNASPTLRERMVALEKTLSEADSLSIPEPDVGFESRLWRALEPQLDVARATRMGPDQSANNVSQLDAARATSAQTRASAGWIERVRHALRDFGVPRYAWSAAFALMAAVGVGFLVGRQSQSPPVVQVQAAESGMASRMLGHYVADHLRATEGVLLTAANSDSVELQAGNRALAANLVESNRMYALAAARQGNPRLSDFLRQLEPVLLELANQPASPSVQSVEGLRDYLRDTDLLFEVRATEARIDTAGKRSL